MRSSSEETRSASKKAKGYIPGAHDDYEAGLTKLWGKDTLNQLRQYVSDADIEDHHIQTMATKMGVKRIYNENCQHYALFILSTFFLYFSKINDPNVVENGFITRIHF